MCTPHYWGFRINWRNKEAFKFLNDEINKGRLRQGWGYDERQKLPNPTLNQGEKANISIYKKVKKGDYLLIPHVPSYSFVTIVQARDDFDKGYEYQINPELKDFGHIFPVNIVKIFARGNVNVHADIRNSLRNPMRFWCMNRYGEEIKNIIKLNKDVLASISQHEELASDKLKEAMCLTLDENVLQENIRALFEKHFQSTEWEFALRYALDLLFPNYIVERVGGKEEKEHGCDLAIYIPGLEQNKGYVIGLQIKDYRNHVCNDVIQQIEKADNYNWIQNEYEYKLIDKYLVIVDAEPHNNQELIVEATKRGIHILFREDVLKILSRAAKIQMTK